MPFKFSKCICLQVPDLNRALEFYTKVMGLEVVHWEDDSAELQAGQCRLFLDKGKLMGPIIEFLVPYVESAKVELVEAGCEVVQWEGKGGRCYMRDPFGFVFNVYQEPETFILGVDNAVK